MLLRPKTLADDYDNLIQTAEPNKADLGNAARQVVPPGGQICNKSKLWHLEEIYSPYNWRQIMVKSRTNANGAICIWCRMPSRFSLLKGKTTLFWPKAPDLIRAQLALGKTRPKAADFLVVGNNYLPIE